MLNFSWTHFCDFIKHQRRYFFMGQNRRQRFPEETLGPSELLSFIGEKAKENGLVKTLPVGYAIYRARQQRPNENFASVLDFGPPPAAKAVTSNRMSPAGIVMFYGSDDARTAVAEIDDNPKLGIVVGTFRTTREATVLDLTNLPRRLGFFEQQADSSETDRYALDFLHSFVKNMAAKIETKSREHVDYVPTQVVTEWFRTHFRDAALDGIIYMSAQRAGGRSLVLFAEQKDIVLSPGEIQKVAGQTRDEEWTLRLRHEKAWLKLVRRRVLRKPLDSNPR